MDLSNLSVGGKLDPLAAANFDDEEEGGEKEAADAQKDFVHIRVQQRNGRKCITTIQGLNSQLDLKKIIKAIKKVQRTPRAPAPSIA